MGRESDRWQSTVDRLHQGSTRLRSAGVDLWFPVGVLVLIGVLSGLGLSGSSLARYSANGRPNSQFIVVGTPRAIRSDEWLASSPMRTGRVRAGFPARQTYGMGSEDLTDSWQPLIPSRSVGAAIFSPFNLPLVALPITQGFALSWWLPFAACALGMYAWLRAMRVGPWVALAASLITVYAPAAVWWSWSMVQIIASAVIPCALLIAAARSWSRRPRVALLIAVAAGLAAAGLPWWYQPWALVVGIFVAGVTLLWGLSDPGLRRAFLTVAAVAGVIFVGEELIYIVHERSYYDALTNTVYPGQRRSSGGGVTVWKLLSSVVPFSFLGKTGSTLTVENLTEVSTGWTLALPIALVVAALGRRVVTRDRERTLLVGTVALSVFLTSWAVVKWPTTLAKITFLDFVPPARLAVFIGFFGTVCLALFFGVAERRERLLRELGWSGALVVGGVAAFIAAWGASEFRLDALPGLSQTYLWVAVFAAAVIGVLLCTRWWGIAVGLAALLAVSSGLMVNPLIKGTAALGDSSAARLVRSIDRRVVAPSHGTWAADSEFVDGLLNGEGVNSLSSFNNPVSTQGWRHLDPRGAYKTAWNRYGYIVFNWQSGLSNLSVQNPATDVVEVAINPCDAGLSALKLRAVVASHPLDSPCLVAIDHFPWMGQRFTIYRRQPVPSVSSHP